MAAKTEDPIEIRNELISSVTALRLLVDGWHAGLVDASPGTADGEQLRRHIGAISELVEDMARADARDEATPDAPVSVAAVIAHCAVALTKAAARRRVGLGIEVTAPLPRVAGTGLDVSRVVLTVLEATIRHAAEGELVQVRAVTDPVGVRITISARVDGAPPELRFAVAKGVIEAHGGRLWTSHDTPDMTTDLVLRSARGLAIASSTPVTQRPTSRQERPVAAVSAQPGDV